MNSLANSLAPNMFRWGKGKKEGRNRSRSMENIVDHMPLEGPSPVPRGMRAGTAQPSMNTERPEWRELCLVKSTSPVVTCILPATARDFVCSALLAVGATPLIVEDPMDMEKDLANCKSVLVDASAPRELVEAFIDEFVPGKHPLVLVTTEAGSSNRRKDLAQRVIEESGPTVISGKLGDIYAVSQDIMEKGSSLGGTSSDSSDDEGKTKKHSLDTSLPPTIRRIRPTEDRKASLPTHVAMATGKRRSPRTSPRGSPVTSPRGVRRKLRGGAGVSRTPTGLPRVQMKGQFRDCSMAECSVNDVLERAQLLAAHTEAIIHLYCANVVTDGEMIVEITNTQIGMGNLHSNLACAGGIMTAVLACLEKCDEVSVKECAHALALFYVAAEEAAIAATNGDGLVPPGTLRRELIDALYCMDEDTVRQKAKLFAHKSGTSSISSP